MNFTVSVQRAVEHAARISNLAREMDATATREARRELDVILALLEGDVKQGTPTDSGVTRASIFSEVHSAGMSLEGIVSSSLPQTPALEFGRNSHKMPPSDALRSWAKRKLGDENAAFAVARAIAKRGGFKNRPEGFKMFETAWKMNSGNVARMLQRIGVHVSEALLQDL